MFYSLGSVCKAMPPYEPKTETTKLGDSETTSQAKARAVGGYRYLCTWKSVVEKVLLVSCRTYFLSEEKGDNGSVYA